MSHTNLRALAAQLPVTWRSVAIDKIGSATVKVLRMDAASYAEESHEHSEGLLVIDGQLNLIVAGKPIRVNTGELFVVAPRTLHAVAPGSAGTLVILS